MAGVAGQRTGVSDPGCKAKGEIARRGIINIRDIHRAILATVFSRTSEIEYGLNPPAERIRRARAGKYTMKTINKVILIAITAASTFSAQAGREDGVPTQYNEATVAQLQAAMASGKLTSVKLTEFYLARIRALDQGPEGVNSIIELNPDALKMAQQADKQRHDGQVLGPLHGIPVLLKDNIDTGDKMQTTAGSFALFGQPATEDSTVAANLRKGGAVILGKTNLSEWADSRSFESTSGWSGRGGQTNNPYGLDRNPCGSSAGSGAAASANFATVSLGSETDGSIVCPRECQWCRCDQADRRPNE